MFSLFWFHWTFRDVSSELRVFKWWPFGWNSIQVVFSSHIRIFSRGSIFAEIFLALFREFCYCQPSFFYTHLLSYAWEVVEVQFSWAKLQKDAWAWVDWTLFDSVVFYVLLNFIVWKNYLGMNNLVCNHSEWMNHCWFPGSSPFEKLLIPVEEGLLWMLCVEHTPPVYRTYTTSECL